MGFGTILRRHGETFTNRNRIEGENYVMKKVKIALWIVVFGLVGLVIAQNWEFFSEKHSLLINLLVVKYETPLLANAIFFVAFFFIGLLITYFFSLFRQYKDAKTIKALKAKETSLIDTISTLEKQLGTQSAEVEPVSVETVNENLEDKTDQTE